MHAETEINFGGETLVISTLRTAFHKSTSSLLLADLHLGKTTHFRNNALPIPKQALLTDFQILENALNHYCPNQICFLGDLFHSTWNEEWNLFSSLMHKYCALNKILIAGNHDILQSEKYAEAGIQVLAEMNINEITLLHDNSKNIHPFSISGHLHPGYRIKGIARQSITLPCFYVGESQMIMPAFGSLTGKVAMKKMSAQDQIWCFYENRFYLC